MRGKKKIRFKIINYITYNFSVKYLLKKIAVKSLTIRENRKITGDVCTNNVINNSFINNGFSGSA